MNTSYSVLLVEDIPMAQKATKRLLESRGCRVSIASTGVEAISAIQKERYDLVLMDLGLPDTDGLTVTETIRGEDQDELIRNIPIIALTAHSGEGIREQAHQAGVTDFHVKPLNKVALDRYLETYAQPYKEGELTE